MHCIYIINDTLHSILITSSLILAQNAKLKMNEAFYLVQHSKVTRRSSKKKNNKRLLSFFQISELQSIWFAWRLEKFQFGSPFCGRSIRRTLVEWSNHKLHYFVYEVHFSQDLSFLLIVTTYLKQYLC